MKRNKFELYKRLYRKSVNLLTLLALFAVFAELWFTKFNKYMGRSFEKSGNILVLAICFGLLWGSFSLWNGFKIGYDTTLNIVASQIFAVICANAILLLQVILMIGNLFYTYIIVKEIFWVIVKEGVVCTAITIIATALYRKLFPAYHVIQINGHHENYLKNKVSSREDKYKICKEVSVDESWESLKEEILKYDAVLLNDIPSQDKNRILKYCFEKRIRVYFTPKISDILVKGSEDINLFDTPLYLCRNIGLSKEEAAVKRIMDIVIAMIGLVVTSPLLLIIALLIKIGDGGAVFYKQKRCTINGKEFWIYKFRSMIVDSEKDGVPRPASDHDDRITPVGKVIRSTRIDEIPQLFNILKGDMSFVGPRPERIVLTSRNFSTQM